MPWMRARPCGSWASLVLPIRRRRCLLPCSTCWSRSVCPSGSAVSRDPRFLGSASMRDFPSPFVRFWYALGVQPVVNPPHRPDLNAFVERLHRTLEEEYRRIESPHSLETALQTLPLFHLHYNQERPHQGRSCGNRPPAVAYPQLPQRPLLPERVDPDRWLEAYDERCFARRVKPNGMVVLDGQSYYVGSRYAGEEIVAQLDASARQIRFVHQRVVVKRCALKGLVNQQLLLSQFVAWCEREARALWRRSLYAHSVGRAS